MEKQIITTQEEFEKIAFKQSGNHYILNLVNAIVKCGIEFKDRQFENNPLLSIKFSDVDFNQKIILGKLSTTVQRLSISNCSFNFEFVLSGKLISNASIQECDFEKEIDFSNNNFRGSVLISENRFLGGANFSKCKFQQSANFKANTYYSEVLFNNNTYSGNCDYSESEFRNGVDFSDSSFNKRFIGWELLGKKSKVDFTRVTFSEDSFLTQSHFHGGISLYASVINGLLEISDIKVYGNNSDSETLRIIKNLHSKQNNRRQALIFHELEMNAYKNELKEFLNNCKKSISKNDRTNLEKPESITIENLDIHDKFNLRSTGQEEYKEAKKHYNRDYIILRLNKLTNNYGLSWTKAFWFIIYTSIPLYIIYVLGFMIQGNYPFEFGWNGWTEFWNGLGFTIKNYLQFLWPTHKFEFIPNTQSSFFTYLVDIFSRIVIGFGIYQMIQAFRKFGKI